jgi:hypothetical protein
VVRGAACAQLLEGIAGLGDDVDRQSAHRTSEAWEAQKVGHRWGGSRASRGNVHAEEKKMSQDGEKIVKGDEIANRVLRQL